MELLLLFLLLFQETSPSVPATNLPPDLTHINHIGCHINSHAADPPEYTLNAKTGEQEEQMNWVVVPFAVYNVLPSGEKREEWVTEKPIFSALGTQDYIPRTVSDACSEWMKVTRKAIVDEHLKMGHKLKK